MSPTERVREALAEAGLAADIIEYDASTGTAQDAAGAVGCALGQIVKTLFFLADGRPTVALVAGDRQADTAKLAAIAGVGRKKLRMGSPSEVQEATGYEVGGVSPVGLASPCDIVADASLQRFERVWAAAGSGHAVFGAPVVDLVTKIGGQWADITKE